MFSCSPEQSPREWKAWFLSAKPEESPLPGDWENKCSDLQRLCVLRSLRPDRILFSAATYVSNNLGPQFADPPAFDLKVGLGKVELTRIRDWSHSLFCFHSIYRTTWKMLGWGNILQSVVWYT